MQIVRDSIVFLESLGNWLNDPHSPLETVDAAAEPVAQYPTIDLPYGDLGKHIFDIKTVAENWLSLRQSEHPEFIFQWGHTRNAWGLVRTLISLAGNQSAPALGGPLDAVVQVANPLENDEDDKIDRTTLRKLLDISNSAIDARIKNQGHPKPIDKVANRHIFSLKEVNEWLVKNGYSRINKPGDKVG